MKFSEDKSCTFPKLRAAWPCRSKLASPFAVLVFIGLTASHACMAETLSSLLELATTSEPTYQGAKASVQASEAKSSQAFGAMLPQVSLSASTNKNYRNYATRNTNTPAEKDQFNSNTAQLNITQPIWRYANMAGLWQADAVMAQAQHQLTGTEQELSSRLVAAWLDVIASRDNIAFTQQQVLATRRQWDTAKRGIALGISSAPQLEDARSKHEQALAEATSAETDSAIKFALLEQIVGTLNRFDSPFIREDVVLANLQSNRLEQWLDAIETSNPNLLAAKKAFEAATEEVRKQQAGHHPTLDLVSTYSNNSQAVGGFPGQNGYDTRQRAIGLQLNIPIYSGGMQSAKVNEAVAMREKARADIEAARRGAVLAARQGWAGWRASYAKTQAGLQAVAAAKSALALAKAGNANGYRTELDVLQAEQQLQAGMRDLHKGQYDQIASYMKLKAAVGSLSKADIASIDLLFVASPDMSSARTPIQEPSASTQYRPDSKTTTTQMDATPTDKLFVTSFDQLPSSARVSAPASAQSEDRMQLKPGQSLQQ